MLIDIPEVNKVMFRFRTDTEAKAVRDVRWQCRAFDNRQNTRLDAQQLTAYVNRLPD